MSAIFQRFSKSHKKVNKKQVTKLIRTSLVWERNNTRFFPVRGKKPVEVPHKENHKHAAADEDKPDDCKINGKAS
ncbi:hypothetical protein Trydic_g4177 [Trypoxylus dichotomus]